jgi:hypothetical protein
MKNKEPIYFALVCLGIIIGLLVFIAVKSKPITITKEIDKECPVATSFKETVYIIDDEKVNKLPFCPMITKEEGMCYDWAHWNDYDGVMIINLDELNN